MSYKSYLSLFFIASLIVLFIIPANNSFAEIKIIEKEIEEIVGKNQSQDQVEAFALQKAKRLAVEEAGTYISSLTIIQNYKLAKDEITALASGIVKAKIVGIPSVSLKNDSIHVRVKSRIQVDTSILDRQIEAIMKEKGTLKKLEKERRKVKELENKLANIKSTELKRLDEINKQAILLEIERDKQRIFREEQRLKARGDIAKAELDILKQEKERIARFEKMRKEQENARIKELEDIAKEKDRIKKAQLENERYWKELARNAEISRTNWIQIDDSLSLRQAIEEAENLIAEISELNKRIDQQFESSNKNLEKAYKQQIAATQVLLPPDPAPKDAFETTIDYKKRLADHKNKVRQSKKTYQQRIKNLKYERNLKNEQVKVMLLKQKIKIIGPFISRLKELQAKQYVLPDEKITVSLGNPDADNYRFPTYIEYKNRKWTKYWNYQNVKEAKAFWKTRSHLNAQAIFQLVNTENNKISHSITSVKINHLGTKEERLFELESPEELRKIKEFEYIQTTKLPEAEKKEKFLALAPQRERIYGIWERLNGRMIEVIGNSGTYIFMGTKDVRKHNKRFLNKTTWSNIRYVDNNSWSCEIISRDYRGRQTSLIDGTLSLYANTLTLKFEYRGKSISRTHKRAYRKYEGNCVEPIEGIWETSKKNRLKIIGNNSVYISTNNKRYLNKINIRNINYIANNIWVGEQSWRYDSGKVASWNYTILELYEGYLFLTTPSKKWSDKYSRIDSQFSEKNAIPTKKRSDKLVGSNSPGKNALEHSKIIGTWKGRGCQSNGSCWTIKIRILPFKSNDAIEGTISYPSLKCKARLEFVKWENNTAVFRERYIKRGRCVDNGWLFLTPKANKRLDYIWAWPNGKKDAHTEVALVK